jgi:transglutaminase-like putative cysteine protease
MRTAASSLLFIVFLFCTLYATSQNSKVAKAAVPAWVMPTPINYKHTDLETQAEDGYLDVAYIKQVNLPEQTIYTRQADKIINEDGIENNSEISVSYDPSYQQLIFHEVRIVRDGRQIDKLKKAKFSMLQQEEDAKRHLYDGRLTALLVLDDVRNGDVIEYAYSIKGFNPVYEGKYADFYNTAFSIPIGHLYYRLITDMSNPVYIETANTQDVTIEPVEIRNGKLKEYTWSLTDVPAIHPDDNLPSWFDAYPVIMVSQDNDWMNIRQWAAKLYPGNVAVTGELLKKIEEIKLANASYELRAGATLRFVQDEVRYLGIEMGAGTHKPSDPNKTFTRRYGDCKDKAHLLVTMLNAMGITATPVLVNTSSKQAIKSWLPSPKAFDHVTVRFTLGGKQYFVDPTNTNQRGVLSSLAYPAYEVGLALADSTAGLASLPATESGMVNVKETFSLPNKKGAARLTVVTTSSGSFADISRGDFNNSSTFEVQKKYKQFYSAYFEKIKADSISYRDDDATGVFTVYEYYTIDQLWGNDPGMKKCNFSAFVINSYLIRPKDKLRTMPLATYYPARYREEIEVQLPEDWSIKDFDKKVANSVFSYTGKSKLTGRTLNLEFEFVTYKDHAAAAEIENLLASYAEIDDTMGWQLTYNSKGGSTKSTDAPKPALTAKALNTIYIRLGVFFAILVGVIAIVTIKAKRNRASVDEYSAYSKQR